MSHVTALGCDAMGVNGRPHEEELWPWCHTSDNHVLYLLTRHATLDIEKLPPPPSLTLVSGNDPYFAAVTPQP